MKNPVNPFALHRQMVLLWGQIKYSVIHKTQAVYILWLLGEPSRLESPWSLSVTNQPARIQLCFGLKHFFNNFTALGISFVVETLSENRHSALQIERGSQSISHSAHTQNRPRNLEYQQNVSFSGMKSRVKRSKPSKDQPR